jgi:hypothetical protein
MAEAVTPEMAAKRAWAEARAAAKTATNVSLDWADQLDALVRKGLAEELQLVMRWCQTVLPTTAKGESCPTRPIEDVKAATCNCSCKTVEICCACQDLLSKPHCSSIKIGGGLGQLDLATPANGYISASRLHKTFEQHWTGAPSQIASLIGTVIVNADLLGNNIEMLQRASNDSEFEP